MAIRLLEIMWGFPVGTIVRDMSYSFEQRLVDIGAASFDLSGGSEAPVPTLASGLSSLERRLATMEDFLLKNRKGELQHLNIHDFGIFGHCDASDAATQTTPLAVPADTPTIIPNDGQGPYSSAEYAVPGTQLWNCTTNRFDFTGLELGDVIMIRLSGSVTTSAPNQAITINMVLGEGDANSYKISFIDTSYKTATAHSFNRFNAIYMGNALTLENPAYFEIESDDPCSLVVEGWFTSVFKFHHFRQAVE